MSVTISSTTAIGTWSGWAGTTPAAKTLSVDVAVTIDNSVDGGSSHATVAYTLDGSTWTNLVSTTSTIATSTYTASVPSGTNLANVQVQATCLSGVPRTGGAESDCTMTVANLKID